MKLLNVLVLSIPLCCLFTSNPIRAQIVPDATLPDNSKVTTDGNASVITGGTRMGGNLFHSFEQFSVPTGGAAFFESIPEIRNIFSRVTGGSISDIDGLLGATGTANLFLLNPNGIIFGPNARLEIGGSFLASTGNGIVFEDGSHFGAPNSGNPVLTVSAPVGVQFGGRSGSIVNQSITPDGNGNIVGIQVPAGQTLALLGGKVTFEGGHVTAAEGRIELGSVAGNSMVGLTSQQNGWALGYEEVQNFQDIELSGEASVNASGSSGGEIQVRGAGVRLSQGTSMVSNTLSNGNGRGIGISAERLIVSDATISTSTLGEGGAGNLTVRASELVELTGSGSVGDILEKIFQENFNSSDIRNGLFTISLGSGASGNLAIETPRLTVRSGAALFAASLGGGLGGDIIVTTPPGGLVELVDGSLLTGINGTQTGGSLTIDTDRLVIEQGGIAATATLGQGRGGDLTVTANSVELAGITARKFTLLAPLAGFAPLLSESQPISSGLYALSSVTLSALISGRVPGRSGDITIDTERLLVQDGGVVSSSTLGGLRSGDITVRANQSVELRGTGKIQILEEILNNKIDPADLSSGIFTAGFFGLAGNLTIETGQLTVRDGGVIATSIFDDPNISSQLNNVFGSRLINEPGGNLNVNVPRGLVELSGGGLLTGTTGEQAAGDLTINAGQLNLMDGAVVTTATLGAGRGGKLTVNAPFLNLAGKSNQTFDFPIFQELQLTAQGPQQVPVGPQPIPSSLLTLTFGTGQAGNLEINTSQLRLSGGAAISTSTLGAGAGGDLTVNTSGGLVELTGEETLEETLSKIFALKFDPSDVRNGLFTSSFGLGRAGNLKIETGQLIARRGTTISASTFGSGAGGSLEIFAPDGLVELTDSSLLTGSLFSTESAGNLTITTGRLVARDGAVVATSTLSSARGGDLTVNADAVELIGTSANGRVPSSLLTSTFQNGQAGNLTVNAEKLIARDGGFAAASTFGVGTGGNLVVNASESAELKGGIPPGGNFPSGLRSDALDNLPAFIAESFSIPSLGTGNPGDLTINTGTLVVRDQAEVLVSAGPTANAGDIKINAGIVAVIENSSIGANAVAGQGGNISIATQGRFVDRNSNITASSALGIEGAVEFNTPDIEPSQGLFDLPEQVINPEELVALACQKDRGDTKSEFIITGRGGLPPRPIEPLSSETLVGFSGSSESSATPALPQPQSVEAATLRPPARGWFVNHKGELVLTAQPLAAIAPAPSFNQADCHER